MRTMRLCAAAALVVAATVALAGCSIFTDGERVWDFVQGDLDKTIELTEAIGQLRALDGIDDASWRFEAAGPRGGEAGITVFAAASATVPQLQAAAELANKSLTAEQFESLFRSFMITDAAGATLTQTVFDIDGDLLDEEIGYWRAAGEALGEGLSVTLSDAAEGSGYGREFTHSGDTAGALLAAFVTNYDRLRAVPDDSTASSMWMVSGFMARGLPPIEVVALLGDMQQVVPIIDPSLVPENLPVDYASPSGFTMGWGTWAPWRPPGTGVTIGQHDYRASDWQDVVDAAALAARVSPMEFMYYVGASNGDPTGSRMFRFFTEPCDGTVEVHEDDRALVAAIAEKGVSLPEGGGAGMCVSTPPDQPE